MRIRWNRCLLLAVSLLLLGFWLPISVDAGANEWTRIGPEGGMCRALTIDLIQPRTRPYMQGPVEEVFLSM